jgi:hypothetical protein
MYTLLAVGLENALFWYLIPLIVGVSLVYGGTRHEALPEILKQSFKSLIWMFSFLLIIFVIVSFASWWT